MACGSFHWANFSPLLGVHVLQGEVLGLSQTEEFRIGLKQPAVQQLPFGWGSPVIATLRLEPLSLNICMNGDAVFDV